jgi:hypothetical protein
MTLAQVRQFLKALPEVTEEPHFQYSSFRVRGKIFATLPPEGEHLHLFLSDDERDLALSLAPDALEKLSWGKRVVGLRVTLKKAQRKMVTRLLTQAWTQKAPKTLRTSAGVGRGGPG